MDPIGVRIAFDVGTVRIGVALSDPHGILASPQDAIAVKPEESTEDHDRDSIKVALTLIAEHGAIEAIVGLPKTLRNTESASTQLARDWASRLSDQASVKVILIDERNTTVQAQRALHASGKNTKKSRVKIDSAAAAVLLQGYLDLQRNREEL